MFVKTVGPKDANIMLVGEAPGENEDKTGLPFQGNAGRELDRLLQMAGISRSEVLVTNVARERPPANDIGHFFEDKRQTKPKPILEEWIKLLQTEIGVTYRPNIVVALGATAWWALTGEKGIEKNRGYVTTAMLVPKQKLIGTYHPQHVSYDNRCRFPAVFDLKKAIKHSITPHLPKDERKICGTPSFQEFVDYLNFLINDHPKEHPVALDIETQYTKFSTVIGLAHALDTAYSLSFVNYDGTSRFSYEKEAYLWVLLAKLLRTKPVIMQNGKFDLAVLWYRHGVFVQNFVFDTMVAAHVVWPEYPRSLRFLASVCLDVPAWKDTSSENLTYYNALDAANTFGCYQSLQKLIQNKDAQDIFFFEMRQNYPAIFMELSGFPICKETQSAIYKETYDQLCQLQSILEETLGRNVIIKELQDNPQTYRKNGINLGSSTQLKKLLYLDLDMPTQYKRRKSREEDKKETTDAEALEKLYKKTNSPIVAALLQVRKLTKLIGFVSKPTSSEGKYHTCYNITGAKMSTAQKDRVMDSDGSYQSFGRWSSSASIILPYGPGNLQNIPQKARLAYKVPPGYVLIQADYAQAEAVVVAFEIRDQTLMRMFHQSWGMTDSQKKAAGYDIHKITAMLLFGVPFDEVTKEQRNIGKRIRHATNYSAGPAVVARSLNCTIPEAKGYLSSFHSVCPALQIWHARIRQQLGQTRTLENLFSRTHTFTDRLSESVYRSAYSYIPQSTVGDLLNRSMTIFYETYSSRYTIALQLHDAFYVICHESEVEDCAWAMHNCMIYKTQPLTSFWKTPFYIDADFKIGRSWGSMQEIEFSFQTSQAKKDLWPKSVVIE